MPRNPKGEMNLTEIRNLARQHNKLSLISGIDSKSRKALIKEINDQGYRLDHENKRIVKTYKKMVARAQAGKGKATVGPAGEQKPQKKTIKKKKREALKKGGAAPVYVKDRGEEEL
jgi:hypothetical protein